MNVAQYLPKPLIARTNEWISPVIVTVRNLEQPALTGGVALGKQVLTALGMGDGFTHMEWFSKPSGEVVFGEIGCRPGGAHLVDQMNYTCDIDLFREWARVCAGARSRRRPPASTTSRSSSSARSARAASPASPACASSCGSYGEHVVESKLLPVGAQRRNWKHTLVSDGYILLRHPDWRTAVELANMVATDVTMYAE
jgi:hypothetical protein